MTHEVEPGTNAQAMEILEPFLDPGEDVIWSGLPEIEAMMRHRSQSGRRTRLLVAPVFLGLVYSELRSKLVFHGILLGKAKRWPC